MFFLILFKTYFTNITRQEAVNTKYNGSLQFSFIKPAYKSNTRKIIFINDTDQNLETFNCDARAFQFNSVSNLPQT